MDRQSARCFAFLSHAESEFEELFELELLEEFDELLELELLDEFEELFELELLEELDELLELELLEEFDELFELELLDEFEEELPATRVKSSVGAIFSTGCSTAVPCGTAATDALAPNRATPASVDILMPCFDIHHLLCFDRTKAADMM